MLSELTSEMSFEKSSSGIETERGIQNRQSLDYLWILLLETAKPHILLTLYK